jgi:calcium-dependent protein kinase
VAIKVMRNLPEQLEEFRKLRYLSHPNILRVFDFLVEGGKLFMVSDVAEGGALYDHISRIAQIPRSGNTVFGESWMAGVMEQVVRAISYCHDSGLVHNDLKPDNIFITERKANDTGNEAFSSHAVPHVVVGDFGRMTSIQSRHCDPAQTLTGDPRYVAPESYRDAITSAKSDVYMIGVMLFELLSGGCLPYFNKPMKSWCSVHELPVPEKEAWWKWLCSADAPPAFHEMLSSVSTSALELCRNMLAKAPAHRPSAEECLASNFFTSQQDTASQLSVPLVASRLIRHARRNFLQNALANLLVARLESRYLKQARQIFQSVDQKGRGRITCGELHAALAKSASKWNEETAMTVFSAVGVHGQQTIEFNEFAAAVLDWQQISPRSLCAELREVFRALDSSGGEHVSLTDFRKAFPCCSAHEEKALSEAFCALAGGMDRSVKSDDLERFVCEALGVSRDGSSNGLAGLEWLLSHRGPRPAPFNL